MSFEFEGSQCYLIFCAFTHAKSMQMTELEIIVLKTILGGKFVKYVFLEFVQPVVVVDSEFEILQKLLLLACFTNSVKGRSLKILASKLFFT